jgi:hypothetical protein
VVAGSSLVESKNVFRMLVVKPWAGVRKFVQMTQLSDGTQCALELVCICKNEVLFPLGSARIAPETAKACSVL